MRSWIAKRLYQDGERRRWLSTARIILVVTGVRRRPAGEHLNKLGSVDIRLNLLLRQVGDAQASSAACRICTPLLKAGRVVNAGLNYCSNDVEAGFIWTPTPGIEIGLDTWMGVSLQANPATHYLSGNTFDVDFTGGVRPFKTMPKLQLAIQGSVYRQFSDDRLNGVSVQPDGFRGQEASIGPQIRWDFAPGTGLLLKYQHEFDVRYRPQGDKFWLEFVVPLVAPKLE